MTLPAELEKLVDTVRAGSRYQHIDIDLIRQVASHELSKGRSFKESVKAVRSKLHQVGGAYLGKGIAFEKSIKELEQVDPYLESPILKDYCRKWMKQHASTRERLPLLESFFQETLKDIAPVHSVLDLACGLNPLAIPWMPLASDVTYYACDIYQDMMAYLNQFFSHVNIQGKAERCDLTSSVPSQPVQLAFILKTLPCLEQLDKTISSRLLDGIQAEHILVSFPARSLGGRSKGMVQNYGARFEELVENKNWTVRRFEFFTELAFLISR